MQRAVTDLHSHIFAQRIPWHTGLRSVRKVMKQASLCAKPIRPGHDTDNPEKWMEVL